MFADTGEKKPAQDAITTIKRFWFRVKTEWTGPDVDTVCKLAWSRPCCSSWAVMALAILSRVPSRVSISSIVFLCVSEDESVS